MGPPTHVRATAIRFAVFFAIFLAIVGVIVLSKTLLIAPPYAVTAYLVVFNRGTKYAEPSSILASYLVVIGTTEIFQYAFGVTVPALVANVTVVALFIAFTKYSHPPALALTIFSYIVHESFSFVLTSLIVLLIVLVADLAIQRAGPLQRLLADRPS
jgi:hypothetical protein